MICFNLAIKKLIWNGNWERLRITCIVSGIFFSFSTTNWPDTGFFETRNIYIFVYFTTIIEIHFGFLFATILPLNKKAIFISNGSMQYSNKSGWKLKWKWRFNKRLFHYDEIYTYIGTYILYILGDGRGIFCVCTNGCEI